MENTINYKEENKNLRLKLELSKQTEREMLVEKELLELRLKCNKECNKNENHFKVVVKTEDKKTEVVKTEDKKTKVVKTGDKKN